MNNVLGNLLADHQMFHSEFQIENFILYESGNHWAKYKQALKEIDHRRDTLHGLKDDLAIAQIDFKRLKGKRPMWGRGRREKYQIRLNQQVRSIKKLDATIKDICRELGIFIKIAVKLKKEKFSSLTQEQKRNLEAQMWREKIREMIAIDIFCLGRLDKPTISMIRSLPDQMRREIADEMERKKLPDLITWIKFNDASNRNRIEQKNNIGTS